ncbi:NACHT domain-containing protein [Nonomuraea sp. 10N515B]|uniref:NACHT domain-containing protein n=1 Tax=Nonomuraea sp. 10N515B TaxID=3457422 RepID=UPI003FCC6399
MNERRLRWPLLVAGVAVVALIIAVSLVVRAVNLGEQVNIADLFAVALAAVALAVSVTVWARRRSAEIPAVVGDEVVLAAKKILITLVTEQWRTETTIRALGDPEPIGVAWHMTDDAGLMDHPHLIGDAAEHFAGSSDRTPEFAAQFRALRRRRLVIAGGPGSGKTTLAVQLLLELAGPGRQDEDPAPVLLPIADWDIDAHPRLQEWLAVRLAQNYPALTAPAFGAGAAKALVDRGHILPILDGLDELPDQARARVVSALNGSLADRDQLILTSRAEELSAAVEEAGDVLNAAAVIVPRPLTRQTAAAYLRTCLPPRPRHDWGSVLAALESGTSSGLADVASSPLGLWLIRTVYISTAADPAPLIEPSADRLESLQDHLLDQLIPAVISARPPTRDPAEHFRPRNAWNPDQARHYLTYLAGLLTAHNTRDLIWWHLVRQATTPSQRRRMWNVAGLVIGITTGLLVWPVIGFTGPVKPGLVLGAGFVAWFVTTLAPREWIHETPGFADLRFRRTIPFPRPSVRFMLGITSALVVGFGLACFSVAFMGLRPVSWLQVGLAGGLGLGLMPVLAAILERVEQPTTATAPITPLSSWRADRRLTLLRACMFGLLGAVVGGLVFRPVGGLACGLVSGLLVGLWVGDHHAWLLGKISMWRLAWRGDAPSRLITFLDDAHRLGLLRSVGPVYQFRHAQLQDHLTGRQNV